MLLKHPSMLIVSLAGLVRDVTGTVRPSGITSPIHYAGCPSSMPALVCLLNRFIFWKLPFSWPHSIPHITCLVTSLPFHSFRQETPVKRRKFTIDRKWKVFVLCLSSEPHHQAHISGSSALNTQAHVGSWVGVEDPSWLRGQRVMGGSEFSVIKNL